VNRSNFVLIGVSKCCAFGSSAALFRFVQPLASLALRKLRCIGYRVLAYNQAHQFAPSALGPSLRSRRCARRYAAKLRSETRLVKGKNED